jgi:hypothetical protein
VVAVVLASSCVAVGSWQVVAPDRAPTEPKAFDASAVACVESTCVVVGAQFGSGEQNVALVGAPDALQPTVTGIGGQLSDVACSAATDCIAVGTDEGGFGPFAVRWNGTAWLGVADPPATMRDIDCVAGGPCFATGYGWGPEGLLTVVARLDGNRWTDLSPTPTGIEPTGISCPSPTWCAVIGHDGQHGTSLVYDGTGWSPIALPQSPAVVTQMDSVSCPTAGWCFATGGSFNDISREKAVGLVLAQGQWAQVAPPSGTMFLSNVDCVSITSCTTVGWDPWLSTGTPTTPVVRALRFDGTTLAPVALSDATDLQTLQAVSCTPTTCTAVGTTFGPPGSQLGSIAVLSGGATLSRQAVPDVGVPPGLRAVSCISASSCLAVGEHTQHFDGQVWTAVDAGDPSSAPGIELHDVDCATASFCIAVGSSDPGTNTPVLLRWDGQAFTTVALPALGPFPLASVDCASPTSCMATATTFGGIDVLRWDGSTWALVPTPGVYHADVGAIACPAEDRCVLAGRDGNYAPALATWADGAWTTSTLPVPAGADGGLVHTVSCSGPNDCVAVGDVTHLYDVAGVHWTDVGWAVRDGVWTVTPLIEHSPERIRLSCAGGRCVAVNLQVFGADGYTPAAVVWNGVEWLATDPVPVTDNATFRDVSCVDPNWCLAVGQPDTAIFLSPT